MDATGRIQKCSISLLEQGGTTELTKKESVELTIHNHYHEFITSPEVLPAFRSPWTQRGRVDRLGEHIVAVQGILPIPREYREKLPRGEYNPHIDHLDFLLGPTECNELTEIGISTIFGSFQNGMKHSISSFDDVKETLKLIVKSGSGRFIGHLNLTEAINSEQPLRIVAHTNVMFGCCGGLDSLEHILKEGLEIERRTRPMRANIKRLRLLENDVLVLSIHEYDDEASYSGSTGIPDYKVISGIGIENRGYFAHTFLVVTESLDKKFLKTLEGSINAFFSLEISKHNFDSIRWSRLKCIELLENLPNIGVDDFESISRVHDKLVKIHVTLSKLRQSQLLILEWNSENITPFERNLEILKILGAIFDYSDLLKPAIECFNLAEITRLENSLGKRLESLENAIQIRSEMTSSMIGLKTEKRFRVISILLGLFVVFEVLGTYLSWNFESPFHSAPWVQLLWFLVIAIPIVMVIAMVIWMWYTTKKGN